MIILNFIFFVISLFVLIKCADYCIKYSTILARIFRWPEFVVSFFIVAFISVLPETTISVIAALNGEPELGLGTLLGSNVADLAFVFGVIALISYNGVKVKSQILRNNFIYLILLAVPLILGLDGKFSRIDGIILIIFGIMFYIRLYLQSNRFRKKYNYIKREPFLKSLIFLILSLGILFLSANFTVKFAVNLAYELNFPTILIGLTILAIGSCLPELIFSIKAVRENRFDLALGDLFGTVITDITIVLGLVVLISPFSFNIYNIYVTGAAMLFAGIFVIIFMKTNKTITKYEGLFLICFYLLFLVVEFFISTYLGLK